MRKILGVTFDLEGPLFDFEKIHFEAWSRVVRKKFKVPVDLQWLIGNVPNAIGGGDPNIARHVALKFKVPESEATLLVAKKECFLTLRAGKPIEARPGALDAIAWFRSNGYRVAIGSNTPRDAAMQYMDSVGLRGTLPVVLAEDVDSPKPDPAIYIETARQLGVDPGQQLVFDDSPTGLRAARLAGSLSTA